MWNNVCRVSVQYCDENGALKTLFQWGETWWN